MTIFLDENYIGEDETTIGFPYVLASMALVAVVNGYGGPSRNTLWGVSLTGVYYAGRVDLEQTTRAMRAFGHLLRQEEVCAVYTACNRAIRYPSGNARLAWKTEMRRLLAMIPHFEGFVYGFDTGIITRENGAYIQYDLRETGKSCRIFYKKEKKMEIRTGPSAAQGYYVHNPSGRIERRQLVTLEARAKSNLGRRTIHEVDYAVRLEKAWWPGL
jgi:hypothetical protein